MITEFFWNNIAVGHYDVSFNIDTDSSSFLNYLQIEQRIKPADLKKILSQLDSKITLIKYISIEPKFRKKGLGQKALDKIILESSSDLILISEKSNDFLESWYFQNGFEVIGYCHSLPVMLKKL